VTEGLTLEWAATDNAVELRGGSLSTHLHKLHWQWNDGRGDDQVLLEKGSVAPAHICARTAPGRNGRRS